MTRFSNDFKIKKGYTFNLEGERDTKTNRSEADELEEHSKMANETISKVVRGFVKEGLCKSPYLYSKDPRIDHYILDGNGDNDVSIPLNEPPSILADWKTWREYLLNCDTQDFLEVLKALTDKRNHAQSIMKERDIQKDEKPVKYKVPMGSNG